MNSAANTNGTDKYLTAAERAAIIRKAYKASGIKATVRSSSYSMGSSVEIRVISGNFALATEIAQRFSSVRRCEVTGEVLSGGNKYVNVEWHESAIVTKSAELTEVEAAAKTLDVGGYALVLDGAYYVSRSDTYEYRVIRRCGEGRLEGSNVWGVENVVPAMARILLAQSA